MLIVRVELHSAITGQITEIARMQIANTGAGSNPRIGDYTGRTMRGRDEAALDRGGVQRDGQVLGHRRLNLHVWHLVAKMLAALGYGEQARSATRARTPPSAKGCG